MAATLGHAEALTWGDQWRRVDVVLVDAADENLSADQFPGVAVVRRIRGITGAARPLIVVVTGHSLHDGLRYRMAKAQADLFFDRSTLVSAEELVDVVTHPEHWRRGVAGGDVPDLRSLGIDGADVERFVEYVEGHGLAQALDPQCPARTDPRSRRWLRHRTAIARETGIEPINLTTGNRPLEWEAPSIRQLSRIWAWAARLGRPPR